MRGGLRCRLVIIDVGIRGREFYLSDRSDGVGFIENLTLFVVTYSIDSTIRVLCDILSGVQYTTFHSHYGADMKKGLFRAALGSKIYNLKKNTAPVTGISTFHYYFQTITYHYLL